MKSLNNLENSWWLFWTCTLVFVVITLLPFIYNDYPGLADYSNHLARLHFLSGQAKDGWQEFYSLKIRFIPNLALDVIGPFLVELGFTPEVALRIFSAITALLVAGGTYAIALTVNKQPPWLAMWSFIFIFNRYFIWGFLNYFFSVGLGFFVFALWITAQKLSNKRNKNLCKLLISFLLVLVLLSHLVGYGITAICIFVYEFGQIFAVKKDWKKIIFHLSKVMLTFLPSLIFYLFLCSHSAGDGIGSIFYFDVLISKVKGILSPFFSYDFTLGTFFFLSFLATLLIALKKHYQSFSDHKEFFADIFPNFSFLILIALFLVFLLVPSEIMRSSYLDKRLFVPIILLAIALLSIKLNGKSMFFILLVILSTHIIKVSEVNSVWHEQSIATHEIIQVVRNIEIGSSINSYNYGDTKYMPVPPIQHVISLAAVYRAAFVPHLFGSPNTLGSLVFNPPYDQLSNHTGTHHVSDALKLTGPWDKQPTTNEECELFDYSFVTFMKIRPKVSDCFQLIQEGKHFALYKRGY